MNQEQLEAERAVVIAELTQCEKAVADMQMMVDNGWVSSRHSEPVLTGGMQTKQRREQRLAEIDAALGARDGV